MNQKGKRDTKWPALALGLFVLTAAANARAEDCRPPCAAGSSCRRGICMPDPAVAPADPDSGPESSSTSSPTPDAVPTAPPPQPAPSPPAAPAPQPAPVAPPPPGPAPGYGPYYGGPPGPPPPAPYAGPADKTSFRPGAYLGAAVGYGAPFGAQTLGGDNASITGGVGITGSVGYQISQHFGIGGFIHYNRAALEYSNVDNEPDENSAWVLFYGIEARAGFITDAVDGWASVGAALGTGKLTLREERNDCSFSPCLSVSGEERDEVTFGVTPTIAFGANAKLSSQWGLGPVFRMYVLSIGEACSNVKTEVNGPTSQQIDDNDCTSDTNDVAIPNVAFAGLELVFRP